MVLERLQGASLDRLLSSGPLPLNRAIDIAVDLCDALEAVHAKGLVHGSVVPANVFVTSRGGAKLLDFGTAARSAGRPGRSTAGANPAAGVGTTRGHQPRHAVARRAAAPDGVGPAAGPGHRDDRQRRRAAGRG